MLLRTDTLNQTFIMDDKFSELRKKARQYYNTYYYRNGINEREDKTMYVLVHGDFIEFVDFNRMPKEGQIIFEVSKRV